MSNWPEWLKIEFWTRDPGSIRDFFVIVGGIAGFLLLWWRTWNVHRQTETQMDRHQSQTAADWERRITDSFATAVEGIGSDKTAASRIGAIYTLERIARESRGHHWSIMETLTAYIREQAPWEDADSGARPPSLDADRLPKRPSIDVQAALTVIGRAHRERDLKGQRLKSAGD